tara:strand:+ start:12317 stop:12919 length:603 start_codon:yes stop_codon:yes gene_type:complete
MKTPIAISLLCIAWLGLATAEPETKPIFSGTDFTGWKVPKGNAEKNWYQAVDGELHIQSGPDKKGSILWTENSFKDFVVELEFKFGEGTIDSGVHLRNMDQIQIGISGSLKRDMTASPYIPGKGYPVEAEGVAELLKLDDWNAMKIQAIGKQYTVWLNGKQVMTYESDTAIEEGPIGLQLHGGKDMAITFRSIRLAELKG